MFTPHVLAKSKAGRPARAAIRGHTLSCLDPVRLTPRGAPML